MNKGSEETGKFGVLQQPRRWSGDAIDFLSKTEYSSSKELSAVCNDEPLTNIMLIRLTACVYEDM